MWHGPISWLRGARPLVKVITTVVALTASVLGMLGAFHAPPFDREPDALEVAVEKLRAAGTSRLVLTLVVGSGADAHADEGQGVFDYRTQTGHLEWASGRKAIYLRPYLYQSGSAPGGVWCRYEFSALGPAFIFGAVTGFSPDPSAALVNLNSNGRYYQVADEVLFGVRAVHYHGVVDLFRLIRSSPAQLRPLLKEVRKTNPRMELPVDVWLGSDKTLRRFATTFLTDGKVIGKQGLIPIEATYDFADFGIAAPKERPPAGAVDAGKGGCPKV